MPNAAFRCLRAQYGMRVRRLHGFEKARIRVCLGSFATNGVDPAAVGRVFAGCSRVVLF
jgi:hypothetical protein